MSERRDGLYGRRKGKPLSPRRTNLMATLFRELALDTDASPPTTLAELFPHAPDRVFLEIGFGGGEHLIAAATAAPQAGFIGVEPYLNGMASAVAAIHDLGLANIRLFGGDATGLLGWLPATSLSAVDLLYPDPWPKKRHWKRRFVSPANLDGLARVLIPGGSFRFASDIPSYVEWTLLHALRHPAFVWTAERADDWRRPFPDWPGTRYEAKALREGRAWPTYLSFKRA
jgi:tRNA (guanine-N7-)-methyltransferase